MVVVVSAAGEKGEGPGQFDRPLGITVAADGTIFVVDYGNHRIQKWRPEKKQACEHLLNDKWIRLMPNNIFVSESTFGKYAKN